MSKTIVICSDGTGNSDTGVPSNVKRLYDLIVQDGPRQVGNYDKGVGTELRKSGETVIGLGVSFQATLAARSATEWSGVARASVGFSIAT